jgi:murein DD-endopeptidase MepM/ murein hydrolase activator NlpD
MPEKRLYTLIIMPHEAGAASRRLSIPHRAFIAIGVFAAIGLVASGTAVYHYRQMLSRTSNYNHLLSENDSFRSESQSFRVQAARIGQKIELLDALSRELMVYSGMSSEGKVGSIKQSVFRPLKSSDGDLLDLNRHDESLSILEQRYQELESYLSKKIMRQAATPSIWPVQGYVTGDMGEREDPFDFTRTEEHAGLDISAPYGSRVEAPGNGMVVFAGQREGYGNLVIVDHGFGFVTRYGHLSKISVQAGQHVSRHDTLGYVGSSGRATGPHLHFELWMFNHLVNPLKYISKSKNG